MPTEEMYRMLLAANDIARDRLRDESSSGAAHHVLHGRRRGAIANAAMRLSSALDRAAQHGDEGQLDRELEQLVGVAWAAREGVLQSGKE